MAKKNAQRKLQKIQTTGVVPQGTSKTTVGNQGTNLTKGGTGKAKSQGLVPVLTVEPRYPTFLQMFMDPMGAQPALPPVSLPARVIPIKQYAECLLSTDVNGSCGITVQPTMASQYRTVATWTGTTPATYNTAVDNPEYASFINNFQHLIPLCYEVVLRYTGSSTNVAGRMYGVVGTGYTSDVTKYPLEPNGCEAVTSDGISCTWYSTEPVWSNPIGAGQTSPANEWMDCGIACALIGGPPSSVNCVSVGIYAHFACVPKPAICGLTPMAALPDPGQAMMAALFQASQSGVGAGATSLKNRDRDRKRKAMIRDVVKFGGKALGTLMPGGGMAVEAADLLSKLLSQ